MDKQDKLTTLDEDAVRQVADRLVKEFDVRDIRDAGARSEHRSMWNRYREQPRATGCPSCGYVDATTSCRFCGISKLKPFKRTV